VWLYKWYTICQKTMITKLLLAYNKTMVEFVRYILYKNTVGF